MNVYRIHDKQESERNYLRLLFIGPPGSGKSSIIKPVSEFSGIVVSNLDTVVARKCAALPPQPEVPLQRAFIYAAVRELIMQTSDCLQRIVELPYHDYNSLIHEHEGWFESFEHVFAVFAPVQTLLDRNALRDDTIPESYIIECASMFERALPNLRACFGVRYNEIDTGQMGIYESCGHVIRATAVSNTKRK